MGGVTIWAKNKNGESVGYAVGKVEEASLSIETIFTYPGQRKRKGIGKAVLSGLLDWGKENGATSISGEFLPEPHSNPEHAKKLYEKFGFKIEEGNLRGKISPEG